MGRQLAVEQAMRRALDLAGRGPANDKNPQVGCVILAPDLRIVAEGWHRGAGTLHAETDALSQLSPEWRARASELTAVVTLEPCNHTGHTGPCSEALHEAGIGSVVFGLSDPGEASSGGADRLRAAGVHVEGGLLASEVRGLLSGWLDRVTRSHAPRAMPRVIVKWAQSLDGRAAASDGTSQWITGTEARLDVHRRRADADGILIGTGTLLTDNPALTARDSEGALLVPAAEQPTPIVLGQRSIPEDAAIRTHPALQAKHLTDPIHLSGKDLRADVRRLAEQGMRSVFVEGGPTIISALFAAGLVDEVLVYVAPAFLGGPRLALGDIGIPSIERITRLSDTTVSRLGNDVLFHGFAAPQASFGSRTSEAA